AAGSRSAARAAAFAADHGVERSHGSYEALVSDPDVDVVYIATPHSEHLEHALLAIGAGKHVLVEKPMAVTAEQARRLVAAAREVSSASGTQAWLSTNLRAGTPSLATINGSEGRVETDSPFWGPSGVRVFRADGTLAAHWRDPYGRPHREGMSYEAAAVARY